MKSPIEIDGQTVIVGISIGIGVYPRDGKTRKAILEFADAAMYRAKSSGAAPTDG